MGFKDGPQSFTPDVLPLTLYVKIKDRRVVAEPLFSQFLHQFDGNRRHMIFTRMFLHALLHHGAEKIRNTAQSECRGFVPRHVGLFCDVERHLDLFTTLRFI